MISGATPNPDGIQPFIKQGNQFIFCLGEFGHFQVDEGQLVVEDFLGCRIH